MSWQENVNHVERWYLASWDAECQQLYPELHWWRQRPYWARGIGRAILVRGNDQGVWAAALDLDECRMLVVRGRTLRRALSILNRCLPDAPNDHWNLLPDLPQPGNDERAVDVVVPQFPF